MTNALDDFVVIGPNFYQKTADQLMVTPAGGVQQTLASALATAGGEEYAAGVGIDITGTLISNLVPALVAGSNITINGTVISAASGGSNYVAGGGISITGTTIATSGTGTFTTLNVNSGIVAIQNSPTNGTYLGQDTGTWGIANAGSAGVQNTFMGTSAGAATQGSENCFIGSLAGKYNVTGHQTTYIGADAGWHDNAAFNTAVGNDSMRNTVVQTGQGSNTAVGHFSIANGSGYQNTAIGDQSLSGTSSTAVLSGTPVAGDTVSTVFTGSFTGSPVTVVYTVPATPTLASIATGLSAAWAANSSLAASYPTGLALAAGLPIAAVLNTTDIQISMAGASNSAQSVSIVPTVTTTGSLAVTLTGGTSGSGNVAIGYRAMVGNYMSTAFSNIAIGPSTLQVLTTGGNNIGIGSGAGQDITTGTANVMICTQAGNNFTTAQNSVAIGPNAFATSLTGSGVAIGSAAMRYNTAGSTNVAVGTQALQGPSGGSSVFNATAVGHQAGMALTTPNSVTLIGTYSGTALTTGGNNTFLGSNSGFAATTANHNVFVGDSAGLSLLTGVNNVVIGSNVAKTAMNGAQTGNIIIGLDNNTDTASSNVLLIQGQGGVSVPVISSTAINTAVPITILGGITGVAPTIGLVAHAGGGQAGATVLVTGANLVATVATTADSVRLPATAAANNGATIVVTNSATNAMQLMTTGSDTINTIAGSTGISIAGGKTGYFTTYATGAWFGGVLT